MPFSRIGTIWGTHICSLLNSHQQDYTQTETIPTHSSCCTFDSSQTQKTYQNLWLKIASFVVKHYGNNKFPYLAVISYFESLIDSKYSVSSIPRSRAAFHIPLKYYFPEQDLLQDEIISLLVKYHQRQQPKRHLDFPSWD